ncbi:response regulator [Isosphaeraceae bacterium EP7]
MTAEAGKGEGTADTILILEDDPGIAMLESRRLRKADYDVVVAASAAEARDALRRGGIGLMLLDYKLTDHTNGLDFYAELKTLGLAVPSILITGFGDEAVLGEAIRVGIRDFLPKTADYLDYLLPCVARVMAQVRTERQLVEGQARLIREQGARAEAEDASRRKDEFLTMLAHELRNPLAAISNAVVLLRRGGVEPADLEWSGDVIERQVKHLSRLLEDLLDVSRIAVGKIQLRKEPLDLREAVSRAVEATLPLISSKGHQLEISSPPGPVDVDADPTRLEQILENLLTNAAKYTEPGGRIWVSTAIEGETAAVRVRDTGVGLDSKILPHVFELFIQADQSLDRSQGGLGVGLSLVRRLAQLHGGTASVVSDGPGKGAEFTIRLPRLSPSESINLAPSSAAGARGMSRRRILVVDDSPDTARGMARLLGLAGHEVRVAHDGLEALETAFQFFPQVILLDIGLPSIDGYEVARRLRGSGKLPGLVLLAVSGYGQEDDRRKSRDAGFDSHLVKPVDLNVILARLAALPAGDRPSGDADG